MRATDNLVMILVLTIFGCGCYFWGKHNGGVVVKEAICEARCKEAYPSLTGISLLPSKLVENNDHSLCLCGDKSIGEIELK